MHTAKKGRKHPSDFWASVGFRKLLPVHTASTAPPETGTKTSVLSKTLIAAFHWFLWSYLQRRDHFQAPSEMRA